MEGFDAADFKAQYPRLADLPDAVLERLWAIAMELAGDVLPESRRKILIYLAVCHLATLEKQEAENGGAGFLASASEGSVSVSYTPLPVQGSDSWWALTSCGQTFLKLSGGGPRFFYLGKRGAHPFV